MAFSLGRGECGLSAIAKWHVSIMVFLRSHTHFGPIDKDVLPMASGTQ